MFLIHTEHLTKMEVEGTRQGWHLLQKDSIPRVPPQPMGSRSNVVQFFSSYTVMSSYKACKRQTGGQRRQQRWCLFHGSRHSCIAEFLPGQPSSARRCSACWGLSFESQTVYLIRQFDVREDVDHLGGGRKRLNKVCERDRRTPRSWHLC